MISHAEELLGLQSCDVVSEPSRYRCLFLIQIQGRVSKEYHELDVIFEKNGMIDSPQDIVSMATTDRLFNGTGFLFGDCDLFKYYYVHGWQQIPRAHKGFYYCSKEFLMSVHTTWYFNKHTVPQQFIQEFNRR